MDKHILYGTVVKSKSVKTTCDNDVYKIEKTERGRMRPHIHDIAHSHSEQYDNVVKLFHELDYPERQIYCTEIKSKLSGYKQQDREKKRDISDNITYEEAVELLLVSKLTCYYCKGNMLIIYPNVKQDEQWTLERINNDKSHSKENCEIACLRCNLKRRCMPAYIYKKSKSMQNVIKLND